MSTLLPDALVTDVLVIEATEAECRRVMAARAALHDTWLNRRDRRDLLDEADDLLEKYNLLVLGR